MKVHFFAGVQIALAIFINGPIVNAQSDADLSARRPASFLNGKGLFDADELLNITLKGDIRGLITDRVGEPGRYPLTLSLLNEDSSAISIPIIARTRGHFRRMKGNCVYPPLLLEFPANDSLSRAYFKGPVKLKLVMPCRGDMYVIHEWLVYKLYNLVTPLSFRSRLVNVKMVDDGNKKNYQTFYGILLEDEKQLAERNNMVVISHQIKPEQTVTDPFLTMAVFQYLIGNTDWSVQYLQNIKLLATDSMAVPVTVPYDFDHAGIVHAPYALPAPQLELSSIRDRRYRGYCIDNIKIFDSTIARYNRLKDAIYNLYKNCPLLDPKYLKSTLRYLDEFYATINNPNDLNREFTYPCNKEGTGNVIIRGIKEK